MRAMIRPVRALMQRLTYPRKFALIAVVIAVPFVVVFTFLQIQLNDNLATMRLEQSGITYLRPTRQFLGRVSQAQVFSVSYAEGNIAAKASLMDTLAQADRDFNALAMTDSRYGGALRTTESFAAIRTEWGTVRDSSVARSAADNVAAYDKLIADLNDMIETVSNTSLLVVDARLDSAQLRTAMLDRLPAGEDILRQAHLQALDLPYGQPITPAARAIAETLAGQFTDNIQATQDSFENAFQADPQHRLQSRLEGSVNSYTDSGKRVRDILGNQVASGATITASPTAYEQAIMQTWNLNDALWSQSSAQLDAILQGRIDDVAGHQRLAETLPVLAALLAAYLLVGLYSGLMFTIRALGATAARLSGGEVDQTVAVDTRDEMGSVVASFNAIARRLRAEWTQAREERDRATTAEAKLRSVVDTALDGIVTIDTAGCISGWNPQAEALFGWSVPDVLGVPATHLVAPSAQSAFAARVQAVSRGGMGEEGDDRTELEMIRRDGSAFAAEIAISALQRHDNAFSLFVHDITERKRLREQEIEYLRNVALVTEAASAMEVGNYDPQSLARVAARQDGLGHLARVFQRMVREVEGREQQLKQQVRELRIEIDHQRTARQVAEITDTDYFRHLQQQAASLRKQHE